jgi:hypothetical protein
MRDDDSSRALPAFAQTLPTCAFMREGTTGKTHTIGGDLKQLKNQELCLQPTAGNGRAHCAEVSGTWHRQEAVRASAYRLTRTALTIFACLM